MVNPQILPLEGSDAPAHGLVIPVHPAGEKVTPALMRRFVSNALELAEGVLDPMPLELRVKYRLVSRQVAFRAIHFPESLAEAHEARRRLAYEEVLLLGAPSYATRGGSQPWPCAHGARDATAHAGARRGDPVHAYRRAAAGPTRHPRRDGAAACDEPHALGRCWHGQDRRGRVRHRGCSRYGRAGAASRADRGPRAAARAQLWGSSSTRRNHPCGAHRVDLGIRASGAALRPLRAASTCSSARTRCSRTTCARATSRSPRSTSSSASASPSARSCSPRATRLTRSSSRRRRFRARSRSRCSGT